MGVIGMSRQFFSTLVGMEFGSHDFDDEPKKSFLISSSVAYSKSIWRYTLFLALFGKKYIFAYLTLKLIC